MSERLPSCNVVAAIIAYNCEKTLRQAYDEIPKDWVDAIVCGDDGSTDRTVEIAESLPGVEVVRHVRNRGMGANQKMVYDAALDMGADIVVLVHGDNQFDPGRVSDLIQPIAAGRADAMLGSRLLGGRAIEGGMPRWKLLGNQVLNGIQNRAYRLALSDYATGYKAYSREVLETIPYHVNRSDYIFDEEVNTQIVHFGFRLDQVGIPTRYFEAASSMSFPRSIHYGVFTAWTVLRYLLHRHEVARAAWLEPRSVPSAP